MKKKTVYLLCGVSGAGKTWVCKQLLDKFDYVPHDENFKDPMKPYEKNDFSKDIITECPFADKAAMTRAMTIKNRANEWNAFHGDSAQVLKHLQDL